MTTPYLKIKKGDAALKKFKETMNCRVCGKEHEVTPDYVETDANGEIKRIKRSNICDECVRKELERKSRKEDILKHGHSGLRPCKFTVDGEVKHGLFHEWKTIEVPVYKMLERGWTQVGTKKIRGALVEDLNGRVYDDVRAEDLRFKDVANYIEGE